MSAPTVRISEASHQLLKQLAEQTGQTMMDVVDKALDAYRRAEVEKALRALLGL
jgi:predicted transcriptional regulator